MYLLRIYYVLGNMLNDGYRVVNEGDEEEEIPTLGNKVVIHFVNLEERNRHSQLNASFYLESSFWQRACFMISLSPGANRAFTCRRRSKVSHLITGWVKFLILEWSISMRLWSSAQDIFLPNILITQKVNSFSAWLLSLSNWVLNLSG